MSRLSGIGGRLYRGETSFDFIGRRKTWYAISALFLILLQLLDSKVLSWVSNLRADLHIWSPLIILLWQMLKLQ